MDMKEKLVEIIAFYADFLSRDTIDVIVDRIIAECVTVQEWIAVKDERKPKDRKNYFIAYVFGDSDIHFFGEAKYHAYEGNGIVDRPHFSDEGVDGMRVTHWMEIPKLPQPRGNKGVPGKERGED